MCRSAVGRVAGDAGTDTDLGPLLTRARTGRTLLLDELPGERRVQVLDKLGGTYEGGFPDWSDDDIRGIQAPTLITVGDGDITPVTTTGRVIAVLLMIGGISLVGSITATLASWIVQRVADEKSAEEQVTTAHVDHLLDEIRALRAEVAAQRGGGGDRRGGQPPPS